MYSPILPGNETEPSNGDDFREEKKRKLQFLVDLLMTLLVRMS